MRIRAAFLLFVSFICVVGWCAEPATSKMSVELHTLKGGILKGDLENITDKEIVIKAGGKATATPLPDVLKLDFPGVNVGKPEGKYSDIELTDGSVLHCKEWTIKVKQVELKTLSGQEIILPLLAVANILNDAQQEKYRKDWAERLARKRRRDIAVFVNKQEVINPVPGTFGEADAEGKGIDFQLPGGKKGKFLFANLHGLIFQRELDPLAPPVLCKLYDSFQDVIMVSSVTSTTDGLSVTTPAGAHLEFSHELLARLDYTLDKIAYLSRLEPSKVVQSSNFDFVDTYRRDKNLDNTPLRIYGESFAMGLALHAHTELEYDLKGDYREFHAIAGIDQTVLGVGGPVVLVIEGVIDGASKELYKKTFTRKDPKDKKEGVIELNIKDVQKLRVIVRTGDRFDNGKHLDLVNAKVQK